MRAPGATMSNHATFGVYILPRREMARVTSRSISDPIFITPFTSSDIDHALSLEPWHADCLSDGNSADSG